MANQSHWRYCHQCKVLYFDGHADGNKGDCKGAPDGVRGHRPAGFVFVLPYNEPLAPNTQDQWRNCWKCQAMYFDGHADGNKGACPSGGAHEGHGEDARTFNFALSFNIPATRTAQDRWRNCWKCQAMYYDGYADKGRCAAGGSHEGHGEDPRTFNFVLPHPITPEVTLEAIRDENGRHIIVRGKDFTPNSNVSVEYLISDGGQPAHHTQGSKSEGTNTSGWFTSDISVNMAEISRVSVDVIDDVTGTVANASLP